MKSKSKRTSGHSCPLLLAVSLSVKLVKRLTLFGMNMGKEEDVLLTIDEDELSSLTTVVIKLRR